MSTRSSSRNLFPPLDNLELTIRRRSRVDPTLLNDFEMATNENGDDVPPPGGGDLPVLDLRMMEELCQPTLNGRDGPIASIAIQATNFVLKNDMIQQVQNSCQFHGLLGDDANKHLDKFLCVTQSIKVNGVTDDAFRLYLFPHSLTHHAITWFDHLPRNSITTFEQMAKMFLGKYFPPSMVTKLRNEITNFRQRPDESLFEAWERGTFMKRRSEECYDLIDNMTAHHNDWGTSVQRSDSSSSITSSFDPEIVALKAETVEINKNLMKVLQIDQQNIYVAGAYNQGGNPYQPQGASHGQNLPPAYQAPAYQATGYQASIQQAPIPQPQVVTTTEFTNYMKANDVIPKNMQTNMTSLTNSNLELKNMFGQFMTMNTASSSGSGTLPNNTITNPKEYLKGITTRDRSISRPVRVAEDVFVKVGKFHFSVDFVVVDFDADPRVLLVLERSFLKTGRALIDVYEGELTLCVGNKAITFNLDQTARYSANYDAMDNDFLLEETNTFLAIDDEPISPEIDEAYYDSEGDILLLEEFLNDDPSSPPLPPQELKVIEPTNEKSSIDEPPVVELKDLSTHLEYAFLEGDDKLPVIIAKDLKDEEKTALINVLKSHKQALAWQLSDIKGINLEFCTHKILMEDDFKPTDQHQRRVNPKIHEVIKKEVFKLLDVGLIYPISDSPWLNDATYKDHFPLPFMDQMLERLAGNEYYCFLDGFSSYFQIPIDPQDQEKTTFTCPYGTFTYHRMLFGLCNAPSTLQRNLFPPLDNPELTIRRRSRADPTLLNDFEMATKGNGDPPVPDLRTMKEFRQPSLNGRGGPIALIAIQATNFGLKNDMIQQYQSKWVTDDALRLYLFPHSLTYHATAWFDRLPRNSINTLEQMAKMFLRKYFPLSMVKKLRNEITNFCQHPDESLFEAWERYKLSIDRFPNHNMLPVTQIDTFYNELTFRHHDTSNVAAAQRSESSSSITSSSYSKIVALKAEMAEINKNLMRVLQPPLAKPRTYMLLEPIKVESRKQSRYSSGDNQGRNQFFQGASHGQNPPPAYQAPAYQALGYQALVHQPSIPQPQVVTTTEFTNYMKANVAILKNMQTNMTLLTNSNLELKNMFGQFMKMNTASSSGLGTLPSNTITKSKEDLKGITTRSGTAYQEPTIPTTSSSLPKVVEHETKVTKDTMHPTNNGSTKDVQPLVFQIETSKLNSNPIVALVAEPVVAPISASSLTRNRQYRICLDFMIKNSAIRLMTKKRNFYKSS
nr:DNA-directed DNA polymerase [Tanacetum cinerariifolium]